MICVSIGEYGYNACLKALKKCEKMAKIYPELIVEIRLDLCGLSEEDVRDLFSKSKLPLIATCQKSTYKLLLPAIKSGAAYVNIDALSSKTILNEIEVYIGRKKVKKIFSFHDYYRTPNLATLKQIYIKAVEAGADIVKICTTATKEEDAERVLSLYDDPDMKRVPLIAFAMGEKARYTRIEAIILGSPLLFAAFNKRAIVAPGQMTFEAILDLVPQDKVCGNILIPTSKSIAQRAIIAAALASGESEFRNFWRCDDIDAAISVAKAIGAKVDIEGDAIYITGQGYPIKREKSPILESLNITGNSISRISESLALHVGESGLLSRLCIPIAAQLGGGITITCGGSLLARKMYACKETLEMFDAQCLLTAEETLPAIVNGPLNGGDMTMSGRRGSQLISGLLMALPLGSKETTLRIQNPSSVNYIDLTISILEKFGIEISPEREGNDIVFTIPSRQKYRNIDLDLEGDWGSAANFIVLAAIFGEITIRGLDLDSSQIEKNIIEVVKMCGSEVIYNASSITIKRRRLRAFEYDTRASIDLFPILSVLAVFCDGRTSIIGVDKLRANEKNERLKAISKFYDGMGVEYEIDGDIMYIEGLSPSRRVIEKKILRGGTYNSYHDHRVVMAMMVASIGCNDKVVIEGRDSVQKSFPTFWDLFSKVSKSSK